MKAVFLVGLMVFSTALSALASGMVQGTVVLDALRSPSVDAGYKPKTVKPIESEEAATALVWLERETGNYPQTRAAEVISIHQRGYQFRPSFVALQKGASAEFPNRDDEFHNVFSYSKLRRFDLGRFRKDEPSPRIRFEKAGLVKIYCEIHQHMRCRVLVLDTPWFAATDTQGRFKISGLPPGDYVIKAMLPSEKTVQSRVTVTEGKTTPVQLSR